MLNQEKLRLVAEVVFKKHNVKLGSKDELIQNNKTIGRMLSATWMKENGAKRHKLIVIRYQTYEPNEVREFRGRISDEALSALNLPIEQPSMGILETAMHNHLAAGKNVIASPSTGPLNDINSDRFSMDRFGGLR